ncbi:MAG: GDSL-type esterase/lipase family protein, partial [Butyrivibrio sp.]
LSRLDEQNVQEIEHSINSAEDTEVTTPEPTSPVQPDETTGEPTAPVQPEETTPEPTEPPTEPPTEVFHPSNQLCYMPYTMDKNKAAAAVSRLDNGELTVNELFSNSLFVGDSVMSGFSAYHVIDDNNVIANVGANLATHLGENIDTIVGYNPEYLFIRYGLNEMSPYDNDLNKFINTYKEDIRILKERLPYTKIIVVGLSPVLSQAIEAQARFNRIPAYNAAMRQMCTEMGVGYYENSELFLNNAAYYGKDGIHIGKNMYLLWIRNMVEEMGLY